MFVSMPASFATLLTCCLRQTAFDAFFFTFARTEFALDHCTESKNPFLCRMEASGAEKRFEGNAEHDAAQAKQYAEGATDSFLGGES